MIFSGNEVLSFSLCLCNSYCLVSLVQIQTLLVFFQLSSLGSLHGGNPMATTAGTVGTTDFPDKTVALGMLQERSLFTLSALSCGNIRVVMIQTTSELRRN